MHPDWVTRGIKQLVRQFCSLRGIEPWIGINSLSPFSAIRTGLTRRHGGHFEVLPDVSITDGFLWRSDEEPDQPELWLSPTKAGYRRIFERFAQRYLGAAGLEGANVQIDHVFPRKAGVLGGLAYVRMLAIPPESNMAAGRTIERAMVARNGEFGTRSKPVRWATYFSIGKATGFTGYEKLPSEPGIAPDAALAAALIAHLQAVGLPADVLTPLAQRHIVHATSRIR
jgi:hypothetical protein